MQANPKALAQWSYDLELVYLVRFNPAYRDSRGRDSMAVSGCIGEAIDPALKAKPVRCNSGGHKTGRTTNGDKPMTTKAATWTREKINETFNAGHTFRDPSTGRVVVRSARECVERAILAVYRNQTKDEQATGSTRWRNGLGFNGRDARYGSYLARWIRSGRQLSGKHLDRARKMATKYSGQLVPATS